LYETRAVIFSVGRTNHRRNTVVSTHLEEKKREKGRSGQRFLSHQEVQERVKYSDEHIHRLRTDPRYAHLRFPKPIRHGLGKSGRLVWTEEVIDAWIEWRAAGGGAEEPEAA
jgi:predicted DNA-binding transcriptional regulator AlpA